MTTAFLDVDEPQPPSAPTATSNPPLATTTAPLGDPLSDPAGDGTEGNQPYPSTFDDTWQPPAESLPTPC